MCIYLITDTVYIYIYVNDCNHIRLYTLCIYKYMERVRVFCIKDRFQNLHLTGQGSTLEDCLIEIQCPIQKVFNKNEIL